MPTLSQDIGIGTLLVTTAETTALFVGPANTKPGGSQVLILGNILVTPGAACTAVQARVRRGNAAGIQIGATVVIPVAAGQANEAVISVQDMPGEVNGLNYAVTIQQVAATGNGTINGGNIRTDF